MRDYNREKSARLPLIPIGDHRHVSDEERKKWFENLSRKERRAHDASVRRLTESYKRIIETNSNHGAGYPVDRLIRDLSIEYTHRFASSGTLTQPINFNYFESFCHIRLHDKSIAPYAIPVREADHLFNVKDFFEFSTAPGQEFSPTTLMDLPEATAYNFTGNGDLNDIRFMTSTEREFVISGFSLVRRGHSLHWYLVGGEVYSQSEWDLLCSEGDGFDPGYLDPYKKLFLQEAIKESGNSSSPLPLEGTVSAHKTVVAGETDVPSMKHISLCVMRENKNNFDIACDDYDVLTGLHPKSARVHYEQHMSDRLREARTLFCLAENLFQLPHYFKTRVAVSREQATTAGRAVVTKTKRGKGLGATFRTVASVEVTDKIEAPALLSFVSRQYETESNGRWKRLAANAFGYDQHGSLVKGKTWVARATRASLLDATERTIYVKSMVAAAKVNIEKLLNSDDNVGVPKGSGPTGVLYVLRCTALEEHIYKVGWTSGTAAERASELSANSGVPIAFVVVDFWKHEFPEELERNVHAVLDPYRYSNVREFFKIPYPALRKLILAEIERTAGNVPH